MAKAAGSTKQAKDDHPLNRIREGAKDASPDSVNGLARAAGYAGFAQLKGYLAQVMSFNMDPAQKLRDNQNKGKLALSAQYIATGRTNL